ncbi:MAG TPA: HoxN/HupN/NixA family nickel/cobalt transporter [Acidobacteriaceae bacterium]|nr:HoxN/HupN/NixA family nickel/cobalt transporter [Acidobacteriaceae bacterium]
MRTFLRNVFSDEPGRTKQKVVSVYALLVLLNADAWIWALAAFHRYPALLGTSFLAYCLGLRHAVDADHIAAIDNVTRKLMQQEKRPVSVGLMFSLGHSTVVVLGSVGIAAAALGLQHSTTLFHRIGGAIGTIVSSGFLFAIGLTNLVVLRSVYRTFVHVRQGGAYVDEDFDVLLGSRGFLTRIFRPVFRLVQKSWHMYPLGVLFGLGFDTATEIGLLAISAAAGSNGLSLWSVLVFPALFAAGMSLVDTTDNVLMVGAYGWALANPIRKLYYNLTITFVSAVIALAVGAVEVLGLLAGKIRSPGIFWQWIGELNGNFGILGFAVIGLFVVCWAISIAVYKWRRLDGLAPDQA